MVIAQRISALQDYVFAGHQVTATYSYSTVSGKIKAKVIVSAGANLVPIAYRHFLMMSLEPIFALASMCITVDRGHSYSDGHALANFWMSAPPLSALNPDVAAFVPIVLESPIAEVDRVLQQLTDFPPQPSYPDVPPELALATCVDAAERHVSFGGFTIHEFAYEQDLANLDDEADGSNEGYDEDEAEEFDSDTAYVPLELDPLRDLSEEDHDSDMAYDPIELDPHRDFAEEDDEYDSDMGYDPYYWDLHMDFAEEDDEEDSEPVDLTGFSFS